MAIEINGNEYSEDYIEKAVTFYNALHDGSILSEIREELDAQHIN